MDPALLEHFSTGLNGGGIAALVYFATQVKGLKTTLDKLGTLLEKKADKSVLADLEQRFNEQQKEFYQIKGQLGKGGH
jgi:hypothetical protein